jgi:hypothetical protein
LSSEVLGPLPPADDGRSLLEIVPSTFRDRILQLPEELLSMDESELLTEFENKHIKRIPTVNRLRIQFWTEYNLAQSQNRPVKLINIYSGVCTQPVFHKHLKNKLYLAWILCPPAKYEALTEEALIYGMEELRRMLDIPIVGVDEEGNTCVDTKMASIKVDIVKMLDQRVRGSVIQKTQNLNVNVSAKPTATADSVDELDRRIRELEALSASLDGKSMSPSDDKSVIDAEIVTDGGNAARVSEEARQGETSRRED